MFVYTIAFPLLLLAEWTEGTFANQNEVVNLLRSAGFIHCNKIRIQLKAADRQKYERSKPYEDYAVPIGYGATFSTAVVHGLALTSLKNHLIRGNRVLDVGCGNGYFTVCLGLMVGCKGTAVGIDHIEELVKIAKRNVRAHSVFLNRRNERIRFIEGDGRLGVPQFGPYDAIHIGALSETDQVPPALLEQLKPGGRLLMPVKAEGRHIGIWFNDLLIVDKDKKGNIIRTLIKGGYLEHVIEPLGDKEAQYSTRYVNQSVSVNRYADGE